MPTQAQQPLTLDPEDVELLIVLIDGADIWRRDEAGRIRNRLEPAGLVRTCAPKFGPIADGSLAILGAMTNATGQEALKQFLTLNAALLRAMWNHEQSEIVVTARHEKREFSEADQLRLAELAVFQDFVLPYLQR